MKSHINALSDSSTLGISTKSSGWAPVRGSGTLVGIGRFSPFCYETPFPLQSHNEFQTLYNYSLWTSDITFSFSGSSFNLCLQIHLIPRSLQHREGGKSGHRNQANLGSNPMSVLLGSKIIDKVFNFSKLLCPNLKWGFSDVRRLS